MLAAGRIVGGEGRFTDIHLKTAVPPGEKAVGLPGFDNASVHEAAQDGVAEEFGEVGAAANFEEWPELRELGLRLLRRGRG